jgi:hypothetical protein
VVPCISGLTVRTSGGTVAISRVLEEGRVAHRLHNDAVLVEPIDAGGVTVRFVQGH